MNKHIIRGRDLDYARDRESDLRSTCLFFSRLRTFAFAVERARNRACPVCRFCLRTSLDHSAIDQHISSERHAFLYWIWFADWLVCAFSIVLFWQTLKGVCADRSDSARLDGCGAFGTYWHVVLPLVRPTLLIISLLTVMASAADLIAREVENLQGQAILIMTSYATMIVGSAIMTVPLFAIFFLARKLLPPSRSGAFQSAEE